VRCRGFVLTGFQRDDNSSQCVSAAGDVNGECIDDVIVAADADPHGAGRLAKATSCSVAPLHCRHLSSRMSLYLSATLRIVLFKFPDRRLMLSLLSNQAMIVITVCL